MSNVLITYESYDPCNQTDVKLLTGIFCACNKEHSIFHKPEANVTKRDLEICDILVLVRPISINALEISKAAKRAGIFIVTVFDDDLINIPKGPHYEHFHWRRNYAKKVLSVTDVLIGVSSLILEEYVKYMKNPRSVLQHYSVADMDNRWQSVSPSREILRVIYAAGPDHYRIFNKIVGPAILPLISRYPDRFDFTFLGVRPDLSLFPETAKVHLEQMMPFDKFTEFLKNGKFDLGLAPLKDNRFSNRKGVVKYIDYTLVGALGIYSNCLPYTNVINSGENGILANNEPDDWLNALSFCAEHPATIKRMAENAQKDLRQNFTIEKVVDKLKDDAPEFFGFEREHNKKIFLTKNAFSHVLFDWRKRFNEQILLYLKEKIENVSEQLRNRGLFGMMLYYLKKPFKK